MICCKIIADFNNSSGSFQSLIEGLVLYGDIRWEEGNLFFADTHGDTTEKKIKRIIKKAGYTKCYVDEYNQTNPPRETDDSLNSWLLNKLLQISYITIERNSQKLYQEISNGLDVLEHQTDMLLQKNKEKQSSKEDD